jgi:Fe-S-cluster containining protein
VKKEDQKVLELYAADASVNKKKVAKLKKLRPTLLDSYFQSAHDKVFANTNCLTCANCCKTTSPIFRPVDIDRISKHVKMKPGKFIETYLRLDEEEDYVLQVSPCAFLDQDNRCTIYEKRPLACREYPHTNRKHMQQILNLTHRNASICPAVVKVLHEINEKLK